MMPPMTLHVMQGNVRALFLLDVELSYHDGSVSLAHPKYIISEPSKTESVSEEYKKTNIWRFLMLTVP